MIYTIKPRQPRERDPVIETRKKESLGIYHQDQLAFEHDSPCHAKNHLIKTIEAMLQSMTFVAKSGMM